MVSSVDMSSTFFVWWNNAIIRSINLSKQAENQVKQAEMFGSSFKSTWNQLWALFIKHSVRYTSYM